MECFVIFVMAWCWLNATESKPRNVVVNFDMEELTDYLFNSDLKNAEKLIKSGIDINTKYNSGIYPIDAAINSDNPKVLEFIIQNGANVNIECGLPLSLAFDYCMDGMIQNDIQKPYPEAMEMVNILIQNGAQIDIKNKNGKTPIDVLKSYASQKDKLEILKNIFREVIKNIDDYL